MAHYWTNMMRNRWERSMRELPRYQRCAAELYAAASLLADQPEFRFAAYILQEEAKRLSATNRARFIEALELMECKP